MSALSSMTSTPLSPRSSAIMNISRRNAGLPPDQSVAPVCSIAWSRSWGSPSMSFQRGRLRSHCIAADSMTSARRRSLLPKCQ